MARGVSDAVTEGLRFLGVGSLATILTIGLFNVLVHLGPAPLASAPIIGFSIAFSVGTTVSFVGNRRWAFEKRVTGGHTLAFAVFAGLNALAMLIPVAVLGISRYVLDARSILADNIAANGLGLVLATAFRFWAYRRWVFRTPAFSAPDVRPLAHSRTSRGVGSDKDGSD